MSVWNVSTVKRTVPPKCAEERAHFPGVPERVETFSGRDSGGSSLACEGGPEESGDTSTSPIRAHRSLARDYTEPATVGRVILSEAPEDR